MEILMRDGEVLHTLDTHPDNELVAEIKSWVYHNRIDILTQLKRRLTKG